MKKNQLNFLQRGFIQKTFVMCISFISIILGAYVIDWLDKYLFIKTLYIAVQQSIMTQDTLEKLQILIHSRSSVVVFGVVFLAFICTLLGGLLMRWASKQNWSLPTTLPKALEFRSAMRSLGISDPKGEIDCVKEHRLPVFIALSPFVLDNAENIRARLYPFAYHTDLSVTDVFERHIGKRTLCLYSTDYECLLQGLQEHISLKESVIVVEKDEKIKALRIALSQISMANEALELERNTCKADMKALKNIQKTEKPRSDQRVKRLSKEGLQWAIVNPVLERLVSEAYTGKIYTAHEMQEAFASAWDERADLKAQMLTLEGTEDLKLSGSFMDAAKERLANAGHFTRQGGRPRKV